ncbi:MAG: phosphoglycerate dehydrogenase [Oligoflexales bacterium]
MALTHVFITGKLDDIALTLLKSRTDLRISNHPDCSREFIFQNAADINVLVSRSETDVDKELIEACPNLRLIARAAVGVGNIDLEYATEKGILVVNTPGKNTNSAAELTLGLILAMFRKIPNAQSHMKKGGWDRHLFSGTELRGKSIGIVGLGNVGHRVAKFCLGFDMDVYAYDPYISPKVFAKYGVELCTELEEMIAKVDVLSLHVPLNQETKGMISSEMLMSMKKGSYVVNAARGGIIKEADLLEGLNSGHLGGVAVDTFQTEPKFNTELVGHEKVWCTPHIGASTTEAQFAIGQSIAEQIIKVVDGGVADHPVNLPEIGVIEKPILKAYSVLAEKLGSLVGQILHFNPNKVEIHYRGDLADLGNSIVKLSWMKGYAGAVVDSYVSFVNVGQHFAGMGIEVVEQSEPEFSAYKSALKIKVTGEGKHSLTVGGVVFDDRYLRLTLINDFYFELEPNGPMLLIENKDRPGVVASVGKCLADHSVNISSFNLSRNKKGGQAMAVISVDSSLEPQIVKSLRDLNNIDSAKFIAL